MQFPGLRGSLFQHIASILYIVMYYLNAYKVGHAQALQITKEVALWADFSINCIAHAPLLLPTCIYRASWYQALL